MSKLFESTIKVKKPLYRSNLADIIIFIEKHKNFNKIGKTPDEDNSIFKSNFF